MEKIRFGNFILDKIHLQAFIVKQLTRLDRVKFEVCCNDTENEFAKYLTLECKVVLEKKIMDFVDVVIAIHNNECSEAQLRKIRDNKINTIISILFGSGHSLSRALHHRSLSVYDQLLNNFNIATENELIDDSDESLSKYALSNIIWHEANHGESLNDTVAYFLLLKNFAEKLLPFIPILASSLFLFTDLTSFEIAPYFVTMELSTLFVKMFSGFLAEYPAVKAESEIEKICELMSFIELNND